MKIHCILSILACGLSLGCTSQITCGGVGLARVTPSETSIRVGESITVHLQEGESPCGNADEHWRDVSATWRTDDSLIIRVDSLLGRVTGLQIGDARVAAGQSDVLSVLVHVR
jgi:hypothetical protein